MSLELALVWDVEDALDIAGAYGHSWDECVARARQLGWAATPEQPWQAAGRYTTAYFGLEHDGQCHVEDMSVQDGLVVWSLKDACVAVCNGPPIFPFPNEDELVDEYVLFSSLDGRAPGGEALVRATYHVMQHWFEFH